MKSLFAKLVLSLVLVGAALTMGVLGVKYYSSSSLRLIIETRGAVLGKGNVGFDQLSSLAMARHDYSLYQLFNHISPADIPKLLDLYHAMPPSSSRDGMLAGLLSVLDKTDPAKAVTLINEYVDNARDRKGLFADFLTDLAKRDPQQAMDSLARMDQSKVDANVYRNLFHAVAEHDLVLAQTAALDLPAGKNHNEALYGIGNALSKNPQAALDWAQTLPVADSMNVLNNLVNNLVLHHPDVALSSLSLLTDASMRNQTIVNISRSWDGLPDKTPAQALDWLNQTATGVTYSQAVNYVITGLVTPTENMAIKTDPVAAIAVLDKIIDPTVRTTAITTIGTAWAAWNTPAALNWAQSLPEADAGPALNSVVASWSNKSPAAALAYVQSTPDPLLYLAADPVIAQSLARSNPQAALAFANSLPDGDTKNQAVNDTLVSIAKSDFNTAWSNATSLPADGNRDSVMANLIGVDAAKNPVQAATLLPQLSDAAQVSAATKLAAAWVKQDPQAFTTWLAEVPVGNTRDAAIVQLAASTQATKNAPGVLEWINTVYDPQIKTSLLEKLNQVATSSSR